MIFRPQLFFSVPLAAALLAGCSGGGDGPPAADPPARILADTPAATGRVSVATEPAGSACPAGGYKVTAWYDANANGQPDEGETASTGFVCHGAAGADGAKSLVRTQPEPAGTRCGAGGTRVDAGLDTNRNGTLDDAEVGSTSYVCNGSAGAPAVASLFALAAEPAGALCAQGGTRVQAGSDRNGNGTLDADEVSGSSVVCSGASGAAGAASLVNLASEPAGANCALGGTVITSGRDLDGNGTLEAAEVVATRHVCHGAAGSAGATGASGADGRSSLASASAEPAGAQCPAGGVKLSMGTDADGNGLLDATEVTATRYLCNGTDGSAGRASLSAVAAEPAGANCAAGGSRVTSGLDTNGNGALDAAEVTATAYACHGRAGDTGAAGANGFSSLVAVAAEPAGANCSAGGSRITAGLDTNRNGVLDTSEVTSTSYACDGAAGATGSTGAAGATALTAVDTEPAGANCANGGSRIRSGLDANGNGTLDAAEVTGSAYVCNGNDTGFAWTPVASGPVAMRGNASYLAQAADARLRFTLPANPAVGDTVRVVGAGLGGWEIVPGAGQWVDTSGAAADAVLESSLWQGPAVFSGVSRGACVMSAEGRQLAAATDGQIAWSGDGGASVNSTTLPGAWRVAALSADGSTLLVAEESLANGRVLRVTQNGQKVDTLAPRGSWWAAALSGTGAVQLLAVNAHNAIGGRLQRSTDRGASWVPVGSEKQWRAVAMSDDGRRMLAAAESDGALAGGLFLSSDGGDTWSEVTAGSWNAVTMTPDGRRLYAAGADLRRSDDGGASWTVLGPPTNVAGTAITALRVSASGQTVLAAVSNNGAPTEAHYLYRSDAAGLAWQGPVRTMYLSAGTPCLAISRDTSILYLAGAGGGPLLSTPSRYAMATAVGSGGLLRAEQYAAVELHYLGGGRWLVLDHRGTLFVQ